MTAPAAADQTEPPVTAPVPDADAYARGRIAAEFYQQALVGPIFYVLGCVVATQSSALLRQQLGLSLGFPLLMAALVALRWRNKPPHDTSVVTPYQRWYNRHWLLILLGCASWSGFAALIHLQAPSNSTATTVVTLCTVAFGAASASAFALDFVRNMLAIGVLFAPQIGLHLLRDHPSVAITLMVFLLYLTAAGRRYSRTFRTQLELEYSLLRSRAEILRLSETDALTGLYNRRRFNEVWPALWHQARRTQTPLTLVLVDLDHFKAINDRHGHPFGDHCLQHFASVLLQHFRRLSDHVLRIGGEEFAVLLPGTTPADAEQLAAACLQHLRQHVVQDGELAVALAASFGIAALVATDNRPEDSFGRADRALYHAKATGRGRIVLADGTQALR